ncbi:type I methionyl aminopeptidase [Candidatus Dependentiae bacterium]|nr:type I methionyl aminopeptidase [Candidatus Dependentiae bacterium]
MILIKNKIAIENMRVAGKALAQILHEIKKEINVGVSTLQIDFIIEQKMRKKGLIPVCKGYSGYKYATCISLNDVIVHGIPNKKVILKSGDFVKIDVVGSYNGYCADLTRYFFVENVKGVVKKMAQTVQRALDCAINAALPGNRVSDLSACIQKEVENRGFNVVRKFAGHGIGKSIHEGPEIPNYGNPGCGFVLKEGMTLAIEPMITQHGYDVKILEDGWTAKTADGGLSAHVEDTVLITENGPEVLTRI